MLESAVRENGLSAYFAEIISVDRVEDVTNRLPESTRSRPKSWVLPLKRFSSSLQRVGCGRS